MYIYVYTTPLRSATPLSSNANTARVAANLRKREQQQQSTGGYMFYVCIFGNRLRPVPCDSVL